MPDATDLALALLFLEALPYVCGIVLLTASAVCLANWGWLRPELLRAWAWLKESPSTASECWSTSEAERYATLRDGLHAAEMHVHEAKSALADIAADHEDRLKRLEAAVYPR